MKIIAEEKITIPQSLPLGWPSGETKAYCDGIQYPMRPDTIGNRLMKTFHYSTTGDKLLRVSPKKMHWIRQANEKPKHSNFYNNTIRKTHFGQSKNTPTSWRTKRTLKRIQKKKKKNLTIALQMQTITTISIRRKADLIRELVVRNRIRVAYIDGAVRQDRSEKRSNDALCLVRPPHIAVADVKYNQRVNSRQKVHRGRREMQHGALTRHSRSCSARSSRQDSAVSQRKESED